jgi:hypothetical protein
VRAHPLPEAECGRVSHGLYASTAAGGPNGAFKLRSPMDHKPMGVFASDGLGWDHVSVSRHDRCPTWEEMEYVRNLFFEPAETAMQLHVPADRHMNVHPFCLHIWRPQQVEIPVPPLVMV